MIKLRYVKSLDGVRGIAALSVMFFHFSRFYPLKGNAIQNFVQEISIFGQTGVTLFFVLSGFLITRILLNTKKEKNYLKNFYLKRTIRIFPLYYLFLIVYYFIVPAFKLMHFVPFDQQWYYWIYLQNFAITFNWNNNGPNHFWSLAVEEHFYLFWPLIVYFFSINKLPYAIIGLIVFSFITRIILISLGYGVFYFTFTNLDALAIGALLSIQEKKRGLESFSSKRFVILFLIFLIPTLVVWNFTGGRGLNIIQVLKFPLLSLIFYSFIGIIIANDENTVTKKLFKNSFIQYTGKISYGLYVYHPLIFYLVYKYLHLSEYPVIMLFCFITSYIIAATSYQFFESRFFTLRKYLH